MPIPAKHLDQLLEWSRAGGNDPWQGLFELLCDAYYLGASDVIRDRVQAEDCHEALASAADPDPTCPSGEDADEVHSGGEG